MPKYNKHAVPQWIPTVPYLTDNIIEFAGVLYKNLTGTNTGTTPDLDTTNWVEVSVDNAFQIYDETGQTTYNSGDRVMVAGEDSIYYVALADITSDPRTDLTNWSIHSIDGVAIPRYKDHLTSRYAINDIINVDGQLHRNLTGEEGVTLGFMQWDPSFWVNASTDDVMYLKTTDAAGTETYRSFTGPYPTPADFIADFEATLGINLTPIAAGDPILRPNHEGVWLGDTLPQQQAYDVIESMFRSGLFQSYSDDAKFVFRGWRNFVATDRTPLFDKYNWAEIQNYNLKNGIAELGIKNRADLVMYLGENMESSIVQLLNNTMNSALGDGDDIIFSKNESVAHILPAYEIGKTYAFGDVVKHGWGPWLNISGNTNTDKYPHQDSENWYPMYASHSMYVADLDYDLGDAVIDQNGDKWINITGAHDPALNPATDTNNWQAYDPGNVVENAVHTFLSVTTMFEGWRTSAWQFSTNDLIYIQELRCLYRYTGDANVPFALVNNKAYDICTASWAELQSYFPPQFFSETSARALVRSGATEEKKEFSEYYPDHSAKVWQGTSDDFKSQHKWLYWDRWDTAWSYHPELVESPVGTNLTITGTHQSVMRVDNWEPNQPAWDNGINISRQVIRGHWRYYSDCPIFNTDMGLSEEGALFAQGMLNHDPYIDGDYENHWGYYAAHNGMLAHGHVLGLGEFEDSDERPYPDVPYWWKIMIHFNYHPKGYEPARDKYNNTHKDEFTCTPWCLTDFEAAAPSHCSGSTNFLNKIDYYRFMKTPHLQTTAGYNKYGEFHHILSQLSQKVKTATGEET